MSEVDEKRIVIPTQRYTEGNVLINAKEFERALDDISPNANCFVQPQSKDKVCMFTFATTLYSIAVEKNRAMQNIVVLREEGNKEQEGQLDQQLNSVPGGIAPPVFEVGIEKCTAQNCPHDIWRKYDIVAVGGTFDRLHAGHRLLLTIASWTAKHCLWIGVSGSKLLKNKKYFDLISSFQKRAEDVRSFVRKARPELPEIRIQELENGAGASGVDPTIQALVISRETMKGGIAVNEQRKRRGLKPLDLIVVDILFQSSTKLSSTALREAEARGRDRINSSAS